MNTRVAYHYADKTNCRQYTSIVVAGTITWEQIEPHLVRSSFIPGQIGLEDLQFRFALPGADHPWHQIHAKDITPTAAEPTSPISAEELAKRFAETAWHANWRIAAPIAAAIPIPAPQVTRARSRKPTSKI